MNRKEFIIGATAAGLAPALSAAGKDGLRLRFLGTGACGGSAFTNCAFVGNMEMLSMNDGYTQNGGAVVVLMDSASAKVDFANCTFAYNLTQGKNSPSGLNVVKGDATVRNTVFFGNVRGYKDASIATGYDIDVKTDGTATVRHSSVTSREDGSKCALGAGLDMDKTVIAGDPLFVTTEEDVSEQIVRSGDWRYYRTDAYAALAAFNVHLRGGSGYVDETTGETVKDWTRKRYGNSPAIDAGDSAVKCVEPHPNGRRVNLGFYGNTPWATMSDTGLMLFVR